MDAVRQPTVGSQRGDTRSTPTVMTPPAGRPPLLSLIIPAYNEGDRLAPSLVAIHDHFRELGIDYEIIVVSDGSTDGTASVVERLAREQPHLRVITYATNRGKGFAVRTGVQAAHGSVVMFTDADLSIPIAITADFLQALDDGYDIAIASRWHPESTNVVPPPPLRRLMGSVFRWCVRRLVVSDVRDTQCGCKAYRAEVARNLYGVQLVERFSFDAEVIFLAARAGYRIKEVPFALRFTAGSSVRPMRDSLLMLRDLIRIRLNEVRGRYRGLTGSDRLRAGQPVPQRHQ